MTTPKRVLMTVDAAGGVWTYAIDLARALASREITSIFAVLGPAPTPEQRSQAKSIPALGYHEYPCRLEWMAEPWDDVARSGAWLLELEDREGADTVHLNGMSHGALPWRSPVVVAGHSCLLSWSASTGKPLPSGTRHYRAHVLRGLRAADMVVTPSRSMLVALERFYGPLPPSRVVPNGRDTTLFYPERKSPFVLAAARVKDPAKNMAALEDIAGSLSWPVYMAGDDDGTRTTEKGVLHLGLLPECEMASWMRLAPIFAHPAMYEPFGLSVLEAAHCGAALVLGDIESLRENWEGAALFIPPDQPGALLEALRRLIANEDLRRFLAANAMERASRFTPARMARDTLAAYENAHRHRAAPASPSPARSIHARGGLGQELSGFKEA